MSHCGKINLNYFGCLYDSGHSKHTRDLLKTKSIHSLVHNVYVLTDYIFYVNKQCVCVPSNRQGRKLARVRPWSPWTEKFFHVDIEVSKHLGPPLLEKIMVTPPPHTPSHTLGNFLPVLLRAGIALKTLM